MSGQSKMTTDHATIRDWAEKRGGIPSALRGTEARGDLGVLGLDFPGYTDAGLDLEHISWNEFFRKFDERHLAFLYQELLESGKPSRFFKFVTRRTAADIEAENMAERERARQAA